MSTATSIQPSLPSNPAFAESPANVRNQCLYAVVMTPVNIGYHLVSNISTIFIRIAAGFSLAREMGKGIRFIVVLPMILPLLITHATIHMIRGVVGSVAFTVLGIYGLADPITAKAKMNRLTSQSWLLEKAGLEEQYVTLCSLVSEFEKIPPESLSRWTNAENAIRKYMQHIASRISSGVCDPNLVSFKTPNEGTIFHYFAQYLDQKKRTKQAEPLINRLIEIKIDLNAQDKYGQTALYLAASEGNVVMVQALVNAKANLELPAKNHQTALERARYLSSGIFGKKEIYQKIIDILLNAGESV